MTSYVIARNNVVYADNSNGVSIGGYGQARGGTDHCTIVNNTLYGNDTRHTGSGEFQVQYYATNNVFENNVVYATKQALLLNSYTTSEAAPATLDYNLYFSPKTAADSVWVWNKHAHGFAAYQAAADRTRTRFSPIRTSRRPPCRRC